MLILFDGVLLRTRGLHRLEHGPFLVFGLVPVDHRKHYDGRRRKRRSTGRRRTRRSRRSRRQQKRKETRN